MSNILPKSVTNLIEEFARLPGIGPKTASRLVFYLINQSNEEVETFGNNLLGLKKDINLCQECFLICEGQLCPICQDQRRDDAIILVACDPLDIIAIEKTGYKGKYHVLGGVISPIDGVGPENLTIKELLDRITKRSDTLKELIIATDPSLEGEATAHYIAREIGKMEQSKTSKKLTISRIARGLPMGSDIEYADEITLTRSLEGRSNY